MQELLSLGSDDVLAYITYVSIEHCAQAPA